MGYYDRGLWFSFKLVPGFQERAIPQRSSVIGTFLFFEYATKHLFTVKRMRDILLYFPGQDQFCPFVVHSMIIRDPDTYTVYPQISR